MLRYVIEGVEYRRISNRKQLERATNFWRPIILPFIDHYIDVCMKVIISILLLHGITHPRWLWPI
jgi:hypothetical protein